MLNFDPFSFNHDTVSIPPLSIQREQFKPLHKFTQEEIHTAMVYKKDICNNIEKKLALLQKGFRLTVIKQ